MTHYYNIKLKMETKEKIRKNKLTAEELVSEILTNDYIMIKGKSAKKKLNKLAIEDLLCCGEEIQEAYIDFDYNLMLVTRGN